MDAATCVALWLSASVVLMDTYSFADTDGNRTVFKGSDGVCSGVSQEVSLAGRRVTTNPHLCAVANVEAVDMGGFVSVRADALCRTVAAN